MRTIPVIAIFDIGKTNKKLLLINESYQLVYEEVIQLSETVDEDSFPCEDIYLLTGWVKRAFETILKDERFIIKAVNCSAYGASFVYVNKERSVIAPLYSYLKPYPENLREQFYQSRGGESFFSKQAASPVLGSLNSGMQLYRIKNERPGLFNEIAFAFHLPQYLSFIFSHCLATDITSIGCHTNLWNFDTQNYHQWLHEEGLAHLFPPIIQSAAGIPFLYGGKKYIAGIGLHDSSAALIPYLISFKEPFILISTGTWCISLNPFNDAPLTCEELQNDCLCYLSYEGKPVKAARLFAGFEHEQGIKKLAAHFDKHTNYYKTVEYDINKLSLVFEVPSSKWLAQGVAFQDHDFSARDLSCFNSYEEAYHHFMAGLVNRQVRSTYFVLDDINCKTIFVDGGFSNNRVYMNLLASAMPAVKVYAASVPQASALGAALVIHQHWNTKHLPNDIIDLIYYPANRE